ncbi:site-specific integrase [Kocuria coralli]|uniref:Site-specific integrase n=1 Tax=Kocuria coralli TaxID=1461025 RepID=A0A5J5KZL0_9MICC|nr:site-specific integrase [Kocuria coralli]KAA9394780.1 site-specific integrase [Kocuria coralli]
MAFIRKRLRKDGSVAFTVQWVDPDTGKQTTRTLATEQDAKELADFLNANGQSFALAAQAASKLRSTAPPLSVVIDDHITQLTQISDQTRAKYRRDAARHITSVLGSIPVDTLTRRDAAAWLNGLSLSSKSKKNIHSILSAALSTAMSEKLITENVARGLKPPRAERREPVFLTEIETDLIMSTLPRHYQPFISLLLDTGLRWGEAAALEVRDITFTGEGDELRGVVSVTKAWRDSPTGRVKGPPKTKRGRRNVTMPKALTATIHDHIQTSGKAPSDALFTNTAGSTILASGFHEDIWRPTMKTLEHKLRRRPWVHDLRHTHASRLIAAGVPLTVIQRRLGHESIKTTSDLYGHLADDADAQAAAALD